MKYDTDKINAIPILDVAEKLGVRFKKCNGKNYKTACLWHDESSPSLVTQKGSNHCYCYGHCGRGYGVIDMIEKVLDKDFVGCCEWLSSQGGHPEIMRNVECGVCNVFSTQRHKGHRGDFNENQNENENEDENENCVSRIKKKKARRHRDLFSTQRHKGHKESFNSNTETQRIFFNKEWVMTRMNMDNSFARCLKEVFGGNRAADVIRTYGLCSFQARYGGYPNVGFPLIDIKGRVRDFKIQAYECDSRSERFFHCSKSTCYWYGVTQNSEATFNHNCLFGEHLLALHPDLPVVLVESPKNACVGYAEYPQYVWVAAGNKNMLKREVLRVLKDRLVTVYPDNDAYEEWKEKLSTMNDIAIFDVRRTPMDTSEKGDIADWIISTKTKTKTKT